MVTVHVRLIGEVTVHARIMRVKTVHARTIERDDSPRQDNESDYSPCQYNGSDARMGGRSTIPTGWGGGRKSGERGQREKRGGGEGRG